MISESPKLLFLQEGRFQITACGPAFVTNPNTHRGGEKNERDRIRGRGIGRADCAFKRELSTWPVSLGQPSTCSGQQQPERGSEPAQANDAAHPPGLLGYEGQPGNQGG